MDEIGRDPDEHLYTACITRGFFLGKTEVSQQLYKEIMGENPSTFLHPDKPVESISWWDAIEFCVVYSLLAGREPCYEIIQEERSRNKVVLYNPCANGFRLPTEAEWEYAATTSAHSVAQQTNALGSHTIQNSPQDIVDITGNVWEMCFDWYDPEYRENIDPVGPSVGIHKVVKGGSWVDEPRVQRVANRGFIDPIEKSSSIGFRLAYTHL